MDAQNVSGAFTIKPYQQRVIDEKIDLQKKCEALNAFIPTELFKTLPTDEQVRMRMQLNVMRLYLEILIERIAEFYRM